MDYHGYVLEWPKLANLTTKSFKSMALKHCFERNFIKDRCEFDSEENQFYLTIDPRWKGYKTVQMKGHDDGLKVNNKFVNISVILRFYLARVEFAEGKPDIPPGFDQLIASFVGLGYIPFSKQIVIKLADEGLTVRFNF